MATIYVSQFTGPQIDEALNKAETAVQPAAIAPHIEAALEMTESGVVVNEQPLTPAQQSLLRSAAGTQPAPIDLGFGPAKMVFLGASITNGSTASSAGVTAYVPQLTKYNNRASMRKILWGTFRFAYPGHRPSTIVEQGLPLALAENPDVIVLGPDFGTNCAIDCVDAASLESLFTDYVMEVYNACLTRGIRLVVCLTLPQGVEQSEQAIHDGIRLQNIWLSTYGRKLGFDVIETHIPLIDHTTGYMKTEYYASADPLHPTDLGHAKIADVIGAWIDANLPDIPWPVGVGRAGLHPNPLMTGNTAISTGVSPTSMRTTYPLSFSGVRTDEIVLPSGDQELPAGRWYKVRSDASAGGHGALRVGTESIAVNPGELLMVFGYIKKQGAGRCRLVIWNPDTFMAEVIVSETFEEDVSVPVFCEYVVPEGNTNIRLVMELLTEAGQDLTGYVGALDAVRVAKLPEE